MSRNSDEVFCAGFERDGLHVQVLWLVEVSFMFDNVSVSIRKLMERHRNVIKICTLV